LNDDRHNLVLEGASYASKGHVFLGLHNQPALCTYGASPEIIIVRFQPFAFWSLVGVDGASTLNRFVDSVDLFHADFEQMVDRCKLLSTPELKLEAVLRYFEHMVAASQRANADFLDSLDAIHRHKGLVKVADLVQRDEGKYKRLQRLFAKTTGMLPKEYARQVRFDCIQQQLRLGAKPDWFQLIANYGFTDQSHLVKEFLALTNHSPNEYMAKDPGYFI
jgi:AraC-like DNA-binding protein